MGPNTLHRKSSQVQAMDSQVHNAIIDGHTFGKELGTYGHEETVESKDLIFSVQWNT